MMVVCMPTTAPASRRHRERPRPRAVAWSSACALRYAADGVSLEVEVVEPTGADTLVFGQLAGERSCAVFSERYDFGPGQTIALTTNLDSVHLFDKETGQRL